MQDSRPVQWGVAVESVVGVVVEPVVGVVVEPVVGVVVEPVVGVVVEPRCHLARLAHSSWVELLHTKFQLASFVHYTK